MIVLDTTILVYAKGAEQADHPGRVGNDVHDIRQIGERRVSRDKSGRAGACGNRREHRVAGFKPWRCLEQRQAALRGGLD